MLSSAPIIRFDLEPAIQPEQAYIRIVTAFVRFFVLPI